MEILRGFQARPLAWLFGLLGSAVLAVGAVWAIFFGGTTVSELWTETGWRSAAFRVIIWFVLLLVSLVLIVTPLRHIPFFKASKRMALTLVALIGAALAIGIWMLLAPLEKITAWHVDAKCITFFAATSREEFPQFFCIPDGPVPGICYPVHLLMHAVLTNMTSETIHVSTFSMENEILPGKWQPIVRFDPTLLGRMYKSIDLQKLARVLFIDVDYFDNEFRKGLSPNTPMYGIVPMEIPKQGIGKNWRIRIRRPSGDESVHEIGYTSGKTDQTVPPIHKFGFRLLGEEQDKRTSDLKVMWIGD